MPGARSEGAPPAARRMADSREPRTVSHENIPNHRKGVNTRAVHGPHPGGSGPMSTPIIHSATFAFDSLADLLAEKERGAASGYYQREGHPTLRACEERLALLEGAEDALLFSSGMAALSRLWLSLLTSGGHLGGIDQGYGGTPGLPPGGAPRLRGALHP